MPLIKGLSKESIRKNTATEVHAGKDPKQAYAIAMNMARTMKRKKTKKKSPSTYYPG